MDERTQQLLEELVLLGVKRKNSVVQQAMAEVHWMVLGKMKRSSQLSLNALVVAPWWTVAQAGVVPAEAQ